MPVTTNYQFQFGSFSFGSGTPFQIIDVDGLEGLPELRVQDDNRGFNDGAFTGRDFYSGRTLTFTIHTFAGNGNSAHTNFNLLQTSLVPQTTGTQTLQFLLSPSDTAKQLNARVRTRRTMIDPEYTFGYIRSQITMFAPDPRYFDTGQQTLVLAAPVLSGRTYNRTYNRNYGSVTSPTFTGTIVNNGWAYATPVVTVTGPASSPIIGNQATGQALTFNGTLGVSDVLVYDLGARTVTLNGVNARNLLTAGSQFWTAAPGSTTVYLTATGATSATQASFTYYSAYV
jgi:hypothetical protein